MNNYWSSPGVKGHDAAILKVNYWKIIRRDFRVMTDGSAARLNRSKFPNGLLSEKTIAN